MASRSAPLPGLAVDSKANTIGIPLHCNICTKRPTFSDVSHLLTHIASKGHLSTYYKIKVRAGQEDASRKLIEDYDRWYATWAIEDLMSERMNLKDQKRRPKSRLSTMHASQPAHIAVQQPHQSAHLLREPVDPRLAFSPIKLEPISGGSTPFINPAALQNPYLFPMQPWFRSPYTYPPVPIKHEEESYTEDDALTSNESPTPSGISRHSRALRSTSYAMPDDMDPYEAAMDNDSNRLKGIFWPGMNMFDAATPEMRRKRNQKKAVSVVAQLEATSREVDATELVFSPSGTLRRERHISGFPNTSSSPLKGEETPPKKTKRSSRRPALAEKDPNTGRVSGRTLTSMQRHPRSGSQRGLDDDEADEALTFGPRRGRPRKKQKLTVHRDEDARDDADRVAQLERLALVLRESPTTQPAFARDVQRPLTRTYDASVYGHMDLNLVHELPGSQTTINTHHAPFEPTIGPAWDFLGQDFGEPLANPLYMGMYGPEVRDDDEQTISAPLSET